MMTEAFLKSFLKLKEQSFVQREEQASNRIQRLLHLKVVLEKHEDALEKALYLDLRKHQVESQLSEIQPIHHEIDGALRNIKNWMRPKKVRTPLLFLGAKSYVQSEPKGVVLILSPWNYPVQLCLSPLVGALAAGNTVIIKPSEFTPHVNQVLAKIIDESFSRNEVDFFEGGADTATALLKLPFDHVFFTGSTAVGKIVMKAAAENLSSVTLELGGKSPALVLPDFPIKTAAQKIAWGKFLNLGQTCIAPDYVLVHESQEQEMIDELKLAVATMYGNDQAALLKNDSLGRVVSPKHFQRLEQLLEKSLAISGSIEFGGDSSAEGLFFSPTIVSQISLNSPLMQEEIFGPILPVIKYKTKEEAIQLINANPKPLAFY
ncbi:MAG: aldehyde dehydrogenase family protein, partial [Pseudobdellovibrionaceae bacterium]